jgi:hypothetical protein
VRDRIVVAVASLLGSLALFTFPVFVIAPAPTAV